MTSLAAGGVADAVADGSFDGLDAGCCACGARASRRVCRRSCDDGRVSAVLPLDEPATISMIVAAIGRERKRAAPDHRNGDTCERQSFGETSLRPRARLAVEVGAERIMLC